MGRKSHTEIVRILTARYGSERRCPALTKKGEPCRNVPAGGLVCSVHAPPRYPQNDRFRSEDRTVRVVDLRRARPLG